MRHLLILLILGTAMAAGEAKPGLLFSCPVPLRVDEPPKPAFIAGRLWYGARNEVVEVDPATKAEIRHRLALTRTNNGIESRILGGTATRLLVRIDLFDDGNPRDSGILVVDPANGAITHERWFDYAGSIAVDLLAGKPAWWDRGGFHILDPATGTTTDSGRFDDFWRERVLVRGGQMVMRGEHALHLWKPGEPVVSHRWSDPVSGAPGPLAGVNAARLGDMGGRMECLDDGRLVSCDSMAADASLTLFTPALVPQWKVSGLATLGVGGDLVFARRGECLVALDVSTGRPRWLCGLLPSDHPGDQGIRAATVLGGYALVAAERGLLVLAAADGRPLLEIERTWDLAKGGATTYQIASFTMQGDLLAVGFETTIDVFRLPPPTAPAVERVLQKKVEWNPVPGFAVGVDRLALGEREAALTRLRTVAGNTALSADMRSAATWWIDLLAPAAPVSTDDGSLLYTMPPKAAVEEFTKRLSVSDTAARDAALVLLAQADDRVIARLAAAPPAALDAAQRERLAGLGTAAVERLRQIGVKP